MNKMQKIEAMKNVVELAVIAAAKDYFAAETMVQVIASNMGLSVTEWTETYLAAEVERYGAR